VPMRQSELFKAYSLYRWILAGGQNHDHNHSKRFSVTRNQDNASETRALIKSTLRIDWIACTSKPHAGQEPFKPDDHSELVPLLPIPNRTVKRLSADDSADSRVKVGHRQATYCPNRSKAPAVQGLWFLRVRQAAAVRRPVGLLSVMRAACFSCEALANKKCAGA
jgi:hypothetical protein